MKKFNRKAFTMVELLAAITILGVLMSISVISISRVMGKVQREYYENQEDNVVIATQSYTQNNTNKLPKNVGQKAKVKLSELLTNKYLKEPVKDYGKEACNMDESYVEILKTSRQDYSYKVVLNCPNFKSKEDNTHAEDIPSININFDSTPSATVHINGNDKLISYNYIVFFKESDGSYRQAKNSGSVAVDSKEEIDFSINFKDFIPGEIKIQVSATNIYGNTKNVDSSKVY